MRPVAPLEAAAGVRANGTANASKREDTRVNRVRRRLRGMQGSGRTRAKQERGGENDVRATQGDADEAGTHWRRGQKSRTYEKAQAA